MATSLRSDEGLSAQRILENAHAMAPAIAARSEEIEALRRLPADLVTDLRSAGFFRMRISSAARPMRTKSFDSRSAVQSFAVRRSSARALSSMG